MQQPTINQLNGRIASNPTIQFYESLYEWRSDWRNRSFMFKRRDELVSLSITGNFIYGAAMREYERIAGISGYDYHRDSKQEYWDIEGVFGKLQFQVRLQRSMNGVKMSVETNFNAITDVRRTVFFKVKSNKTFEELGAREYFEKRILPQYLYAPGIFRNIQIWMNCGKKEALQKYKELKENGKEPFEVDVFKAWRRLFKRRLNIQVADFFPEHYLPAIYKSYQYQNKRKILFKQPSTFELHDYYSNEHDDDENMESFVNEYFDSNFPKNAIFI
jgi:hypothetical protein